MWTKAFLITAFGFVAMVAGTKAQKTEPAKQHYLCTCIVFDHLSNKILCEVELTPEQFQKCFKKDHEVGGERLEIPKDPEIFGVMVLTNYKEVFVMPFTQWEVGDNKYYCCQSQSLGASPEFSVLTDSMPKFFTHIKKELETIASNRHR